MKRFILLILIAVGPCETAANLRVESRGTDIPVAVLELSLKRSY